MTSRDERSRGSKGQKHRSWDSKKSTLSNASHSQKVPKKLWQVMQLYEGLFPTNSPGSPMNILRKNSLARAKGRKIKRQCHTGLGGMGMNKKVREKLYSEPRCTGGTIRSCSLVHLLYPSITVSLLLQKEHQSDQEKPSHYSSIENFPN